MNEKKNEMEVGVKVRLPEKPKRSRQDELVQTNRLLAIAIVILIASTGAITREASLASSTSAPAISRQYLRLVGPVQNSPGS